MVWKGLLDQSLPTEAERLEDFAKKVDSALDHVNDNFCHIAYKPIRDELPGVICNIHLYRQPEIKILRRETVGEYFNGTMTIDNYSELLNPNKRGFAYANLIFIDQIDYCESSNS